MFDRRSGALNTLQFAEVSGKSRRMPSWLAAQRHAGPQVQPPPSALRPPRAPVDLIPLAEEREAEPTSSRARETAEGPRVVPQPSKDPAPKAPPPAPQTSTAGPASVFPRDESLVGARGMDTHGSRPFGVVPAAEPPPPVFVGPDPILVAQLEQSILDLEATRAAMLAENENRIARLAMAVARKVIGREVRDSSVLTALVREGLAALGEHNKVAVRLGPALEQCQESVIAELRGAGGEARVTIDPQLAPYGCVVATEMGEVDESVEARLNLLLQQIDGDGELGL